MKVAVLGAGSWGTTLASLLSPGHEVVLWARDAEVAEEVEQEHRNEAYLPGFVLGSSLRATADPERALRGADLVVVAVPSKYFRGVMELTGPSIPADADVVSVTKGIELGTGARMSEVVRDVTDHDAGRVCALSGPNLAREVMAGHPSATVLACTDDARAERLRHAMTTETFRVFTNRDLIGCEVGGAVKNVIALAAGIGDGLGYGWNTKAALITRGLTEVARLGVALGANPMTFLGLAGNGDLTATCASPQSRNRHVGEQLGAGRALEEIIDEMHMVAEGVSTTGAVVELARRLDVPMPISHKVESVLTGVLSPEEAVRQLMHHDPGPELDGLA